MNRNYYFWLVYGCPGHKTFVLMCYLDNNFCFRHTTNKKNKIDPMVCYEVAHELELSLIEICMTKGFDEAKIEVRKHIAEMDWKTRKEEMMRYRV